MKDSNVSPTRTYALIVGVEKYASGLGPDLDGPVHDAYTFADWLVRQEVPQENIALLLSPLDSNHKSLDEWSRSPQWSATRQGVSDAVTQWLLKQTGDLLWVFWGGHGVMTATRSRRLFYADTTPTDWHHLHLESLLTHLSSDYLPGFQQQIYLIDTCANYQRQLPQERLGYGDRFPSGVPTRGCEQFVFFAAREGEVAKNLAQEQTGLFSKIVLEELSKEPSPSWPPDMEMLAGRVREYFSDPTKVGKKEQTPTFASYRTRDSREYFFGKQAEQASPIWNVPYRRNPHFTGRDEQLDRLDQQLSPEAQDNLTTTRRAALTQPQAIKGLGGIGKTQIAIEYAYRSRDRDRYTHTFWINAASEEALLTSFIALAEQIPAFPAKDETDQRKLIEAVKRWMEQCQQRWLLIFDNADDIALVQNYLPQRVNKGSILLTTRANAVGALAASLEVTTMGFVEGTQLLLRRAQRFENASDEEFNQAGNIVVAIDHFPLALDQAGAYIEETGCGFAGYLQMYHTRRKELLARRGDLKTIDYPASVMTTWSLSFQKVEQANPAAAELLHLCAFLAPDSIPEELITNGAPYWNPPLQQAAADLFAFNQMIEELLKFSLMQRLAETQILRIHRLIQAVQLDTIEPEGQYQWAKRVVQAVSQAFPDRPEDIASWPQCLRYLDQAQTSSLLIEQHLFSFIEAASLLSRTGIYLAKQASYALAEPLYQRALHIREQSLGPDHPDVASPLNGLAILYERQGKYSEAEPLLKQALHIREQNLGPDHPDTQTIRKNYAVFKFYRNIIRFFYILVFFICFIIWLYHKFDLLGWIALAFTVLLSLRLVIGSHKYFLRRGKRQPTTNS